MDDLTRRAREALVDVTPGPWKEFIDDSSGQWTGWPLSIDATSIEDKCVVRTGGQWPYEWDAKTSQHEACANARFIAAARDLVPALADRLEAQEALLREAMAALEEIEARDKLPTPSYGRVTPGQYAYVHRAGPFAEIARATLAKLRAHMGETE